MLECSYSNGTCTICDCFSLVQDANGRTFYVDHVNRHTQWQRPSVSVNQGRIVAERAAERRRQLAHTLARRNPALEVATTLSPLSLVVSFPLPLFSHLHVSLFLCPTSLTLSFSFFCLSFPLFHSSSPLSLPFSISPFSLPPSLPLSDLPLSLPSPSLLICSLKSV